MVDLENFEEYTPKQWRIIGYIALIIGVGTFLMSLALKRGDKDWVLLVLFFGGARFCFSRALFLEKQKQEPDQDIV